MLNIDIAELMHTFLSGTGQNHPPTKTPLWPKPPSGKKKKNPTKTPLQPKPPSYKNPPLAKTPLRQKAPSEKKTSCQPPSSPCLINIIPS